jgi:hypothetical protein
MAFADTSQFPQYLKIAQAPLAAAKTQFSLPMP